MGPRNWAVALFAPVVLGFFSAYGNTACFLLPPASSAGAKSIRVIKIEKLVPSLTKLQTHIRDTRDIREADENE